MPDGPLLSVVVPFYGVEDYIRPALESLRRQTLTDLEVVMVDDGSPDRSVDVAAEYAERDERFVLVRQPNAGLGPARNTGVDHAHGRFLTFVDSDDLVPWQAYEHMVEMLGRTRSSFVSGNARRFNRSGGVRQSWTHAEPFARTREATHISIFPSLLRDRMAWNRVYRRSFFDDQGLRFPPIRYEDYPISLAAHLAATTVDVTARHVYYWRERESGDSITQQTFRYDNMLDRVRSAEMVCRIVATARPVVRRGVHAYLADIDLTALAQAFETIDDSEAEALIELGRELCDALEPAVLRSRPRFANLQYDAIRRGDVDLLRELARFRSRGGLVGGVRVGPSIVPGRVTTHYPGRRPGPWPGRLYTLPTKQLVLVTRTRRVEADGEDLVVNGTAEIKHLRVSPDSVLSIDLVGGATRVPLEVTRFHDVDSHAERSLVGFAVRVPAAVLRSFPMIVWPLRFDVTLTVGTVRRRGRLAGPSGGSVQFSPVLEPDPGVFVHVGRSAHAVTAVHRTTRPPVVDRISADDGLVELTGRVWDRPAWLELVVVGHDRRDDRVVRARLDRPDGETTRFTARVPATALVHSVVPADPYTLESSWTLRIRTDLAERSPVWPAFDDAVVVAVDDETVLTVRRGAGGGGVRVCTAPPEVVADRLEIEGDTLLVSGPTVGIHPVSLSWRRFLSDSDDYVAHEIPLRVEQGRWYGRAALRPLAHDLDRSRQEPGAPLADWVLFAVSSHDTEPSVRLEPQALATLPVDRPLGHRRMTLTERRETLHVEVR